jgi:hypothetical protein
MSTSRGRGHSHGSGGGRERQRRNHRFGPQLDDLGKRERDATLQFDEAMKLAREMKESIVCL